MDLLRWPIVGSFLRWRHSRTTLQLILLAVAAVVVIHGFIGPDFAAGNLSTVLTWVHYRGLLVVALLAIGNLFCAGCPMIRVRDWGRALRAPTMKWPGWLRGKWLALTLFALVLFSYELFDLWSLPRATAWLVLAYFAGALVVDLVFTGASFCKHVCPVGQFNFVASTVSPFEVRIRSTATCESCRTEDCIAGRPASPLTKVPAQRGCELGLFQPAKVGNIDCTFCLDCVQACPHDNIAIAARVPAVELADDSRRSAIGVLSQRRDMQALVVVFVFGALVNAFAMTGPAFSLESWLVGVMGTTAEALVLGVVFALGLMAAPALLLATTSTVSRLLVAVPSVRAETRPARMFIYGLVPFGFGMWLSHYGFHLLTGMFVFIPVTQSAAVGLTGTALLGEPLWRWSGMRPGAVLPIQLGLLLVGTLGSAGLMSLIAERAGDRSGRSAIPWIVLVFVLAALAAWILVQPMDMRGLNSTA